MSCDVSPKAEAKAVIVGLQQIKELKMKEKDLKEREQHLQEVLGVARTKDACPFHFVIN